MSTLTLVPLNTQQNAVNPRSESEGNASSTNPPIVVGPAGVTIGRAAGSDVALADPHHRLSRLQAVIGGTDGFRLRNVGRGGPVRLDGRRLTAGTDRSLSEGQQVQIGTHQFLVRIDSTLPAQPVEGQAPLRTVAMVAVEEPRTELLAEDEIERFPDLPQGSAKTTRGQGFEQMSSETPWPQAAPFGPAEEADPFADLLGPAPSVLSLPTEWADPDAQLALQGMRSLPGLGDQASGPLDNGEIDRFIDGLAMVDERTDQIPVSAADARAASPLTDATSGALLTAWRPPHAIPHREYAMSASPVRTTAGSSAVKEHVARNAASLGPLRTQAPAEQVAAPLGARHSPNVVTVTAFRPGPDAMTSPARDDAAMCDAFWQAAGLPEQMGCRDPAVMAAAGALLHAAVDALLEQQSARTAAKHALALQVTTIQPRDNNPLKFSPDAGSAIAMLLRPNSHAFKAGPQAVKALATDLSDHHAASTAAMHSALHQVLRRLDPAKVESFNPPAHRLEAWLPRLRAARLWAAYRQQHQRALTEGDGGWRAFAERSYAQSYQEHLQRQRQQRDRSLSGAPGAVPSSPVDPKARSGDRR